MLKIAVVGIGHLGKIHLKCLQETPFELVGVYDIDQEKSIAAASQWNTQNYTDLEHLIREADVIDIVASTAAHYELARRAITAGKHVFIEKPISSTFAQATELEKLYKTKTDLKLQVGHVERYNPALVALEGEKLNPQFIEIHRLSSYNMRGTDVSVVHDLMIHDLDVLAHIVDSPVKKIDAKGVSIVSESFDICNARLVFENNCVANITASRISMKEMRKFRVFQADAYINIDFLEKKAQIIRLADEASENVIPLKTPKGEKFISFSSPKTKETNAIMSELHDFHDAIVNNSEVKVGIHDAMNALDLAEKIERTAKES